MTWVDTSGNLWLFGGSGITNSWSDLWKYSISTNEWTWEKGPNTGNNTGNYGYIGYENAANYPGSRGESNATWTDSHNNLWIGTEEGLDKFNRADNSFKRYSAPIIANR